MEPKILICTVDCWNSKNGANTANTFASLFGNRKAEDLAGLYIREELPDSDRWSRFFQISEAKVIKSIFKPGIQTGREVKPCQEMSESDEKVLEESRQLYNKNRKKRSIVKLFIREALWKLGKWKSKELDAFLDSFQPDIVVFGMEGYIHFNRLCRYIVKHTGAKAVGYFWDDTFTYRQRGHLLGYRILRFFQRRSLKKLAPVCDAFWAITEKTKQEADEFFGIDCQVITKPIDYEQEPVWKSYTPHDPVKMLYAGNLLIGRFQTVQAISNALARINRDGVKLELDVYSASYIPPEELAKLSKFVHMKGVVAQSQIQQLQEEADILVFAEAMSGNFSKIARLSFSTKLTEYFHSGKCILAVGAANVAPMEYLQAEDAALCASTEEEIYLQLKKLTEDPGLIAKQAQAAYLCGVKNHSRAVIEEKIAQTFQAVCCQGAE